MSIIDLISKRYRWLKLKSKPSFLWIILSILCLATASAFAKQAGIATAGKGLLLIILNPWYIAELVILFLQACCWIMVLRRLSLSFAYPLMSFVFGINLLTAWLIFREAVHLNHVVGIVFIIGGVSILSKTAHQ